MVKMIKRESEVLKLVTLATAFLLGIVVGRYLYRHTSNDLLGYTFKVLYAGLFVPAVLLELTFLLHIYKYFVGKKLDSSRNKKADDIKTSDLSN